jgi:6-pyruvoyltetrahydropterin/6-carboxytetrahydropterin synthase
VNSVITAERYHDFSCGHKVTGHESKCAHLHGHNYRVHFRARAELLDGVGRVIDFSVLKATLCQWLEDNWDHKFLIWSGDDTAAILKTLDPDGVVWVHFNPTAENMALFLLERVGPLLLANTGVTLESVTVEETRKCSATARIG